MSHRTAGKLSLMAAAFLAPAAAQAASPVCSGEKIMADSGGASASERGRTTIVRSGSGHTATVTRTDPDGTVHVEQHGRDHATLAVQSGDGSRLVIDQRGSTAEAEVTQDGACNATDLAQAGDGNRAVVSQSGSGNRAVVRQGGSAQ